MAAKQMTVLPGRIPYTSETEGHVVVRPAARMAGRKLVFEASFGDRKIIAPRALEAGRKAALGFSLDALPEGNSDLDCRLLADGEEVARSLVRIQKLTPRPNEVKIDHVGRGLIVDGLPFVPFGYYCDDSPGKHSTQLIDEEVCQGFNMMMPYRDRPRTKKARAEIRRYMDRCAEVGMKVMYATYWVYFPKGRKMGEKQWAELRAEIEEVRDHPALLGYYLADEPGLSGVSEALLDRAYREIKATDPYHPVMLVHLDPKQAPGYMNCLDIVMVDPYPFGGRKVTMVADWIAGLQACFGDTKPIWIASQAFGGVYYWPREPSRQEQRVMTYLAFIHGATGIQYFINRPRPTHGYVSPNSPRLWNECRALSLEAAELAPALLSAESPPALRCAPKAIHASAWKDRGMVTVLAANTKNKPDRCEFVLEEPRFSGKAEVLFESRILTVKGGRFSDMIDAFGTRAYQLPVGPMPRERLRVARGNLVANPSFEETPNVGTPAGSCTTSNPGPGSTYFLDSRVAVHGRHSLRLRAPPGEKVGIVPVRFALKAGRSYKVSIWGRTDKPGMRFTLGLDHVKPARRKFTLTREWKEYTMTATAAKSRDAAEPFLEITGGTAWFDLVQVVPVRGKRK